MTSQAHPEVVALTDAGQVREHNEDSIGTPVLMQVPREQRERKGDLLAVADGMGGHAGGEVASKLGIRTLYQHYYGDPSADLAASLLRAVEAANQAIYAQGQAASGLRSMGTTLVAAVVHDQRLIIANVGDSRAYLARGRRLWQLTRDHSWVAESVAAGYLSEQEAQRSDRRNLITRFLGQGPDVRVDIFRERLRAGDTVLLCSDGLTNEVSDAEIARELGGGSSREATEKLVALANQRGGRDNVSVAVYRLTSHESRPFPVRPVVAAVALALMACMVLVVWLAVGTLIGGDEADETPKVAATEVQFTERPPTSSAETDNRVEGGSTPAVATAVPSAIPTQTAMPLVPEAPVPTPTDTPTPEASVPPAPAKIPFAKVRVNLPLYAGCPMSLTEGCTAADGRAGLAAIFGQDVVIGDADPDAVSLTVTPLLCVKGTASDLKLEKVPWFFQASLSLEVPGEPSSQRYLVHMWSLGGRAAGDFPRALAPETKMTVCGRPMAQVATLGKERILEARFVFEWREEQGPVPWFLPLDSQAPVWLAGKGKDLGPWSCWPILPGEMNVWAKIADSPDHSWMADNWTLSYAQWDSGDSGCGQGFQPVRLGQMGPAIFGWSGQDYLHLLIEFGGK